MNAWTLCALVCGSVAAAGHTHARPREILGRPAAHAGTFSGHDLDDARGFADGKQQRTADGAEAAGPPADRVAWLVQQLGTDALRFRPSGDGFHSHGSFFVATPAARYFYKQVPLGPGPDGATVRARVFANNAEAAQLGFGAEVVAQDEASGALLLAFVDGEVGSEIPDAVARFRLPTLKTLRELHQTTAAGTGVVNDAVAQHGRCNALHLRAAAVADASPPLLARAVTLCHAATARLAAMPRPLARVHNDLHPRNLVLARGVVHLLDWDTLGWGDPLHDLALYALQHSIEANELLPLLVDYQADEDGLDRLQLYLTRLHAQRYLTLLVGMPWDQPEVRHRQLTAYEAFLHADADLFLEGETKVVPDGVDDEAVGAAPGVPGLDAL